MEQMTQSQLDEQRDSDVMASIVQSAIDPIGRKEVLAGYGMSIPDFMDAFYPNRTLDGHPLAS
jgi:hypothetical protein